MPARLYVWITIGLIYDAVLQWWGFPFYWLVTVAGIAIYFYTGPHRPWRAPRNVSRATRKEPQ